MDIEKTNLEGIFVLTPKKHLDSRGYFFESYNKKVFEDLGITDVFVQDNQSFSKYGVLRGLHFQRPPHAQSKLVRVLQGTILDVAVDIRPSSPTFGKHFSIELSSENQKQLYVPLGFAHGFVTLSEEAEIIHKCDHYYNKEAEGGLLYNDPVLKNDWKMDENDILLSDKDKKNILFSSLQLDS